MKLLSSLALFAASSLAFAQSGGIGAITVSPSPAKVGEPVKITITADGEAPTYCGLEVRFNDGTEKTLIKIDSSKQQFPVGLSKTFAKPGTYMIQTEGRKVTTHLPCQGKAEVKLVVEGAPPPAAPTCPEGWKMAGKPGKAGDYTCKAGKGAAKPAQPLACGEGLEYFANDKAKQVGCRKAKRK